MKWTKALLAMGIGTGMFALWGCLEDKDTLTGPLDESKDTSASPLDESWVYPLKVGNKWEYVRRFTVSEIPPDYGREDPLQSRTLVDSFSVEIIGTKILDNSTGFAVREAYHRGGGEKSANDFSYRNSEDGLYLWPSTGASMAAPKLGVEEQYSGMVGEFNPFATEKISGQVATYGSSLEMSSPVRVLAYPLSLGLEWSFRKVGNTILYSKKVVGEEEVRVPAGTFRCLKIEWFTDVGRAAVQDTIEVYDYISSEGLIKRFRAAEWGQETFELISLSLQ